MNQEYLEFVKALRPIDDIFMKVIFNDQHCIELLFNIIFEEDISITKWHIQDEYRNLHGRTVIMDIVASTENGNIIDVEMERSLKNASPLRARFHASILDSSLSYVNEKWEKLPEIYVIFICEKDVLETNRLKNHIQRYREDGKAFEDKVHIIDMNAAKEDKTPLGKLMHDLRCENHKDMYCEVLKERVRYFKQEEGGKKIMCDMMEKLEKRGEKRGEMKSLIQILLKKFPGMNFEWVKECNEKQIEKIQDHILMNISYEEFYRLILSGINADSLELLNKLTIEAYARKGITPTTDLSVLSPQGYPVFDDLDQVVAVAQIGFDEFGSRVDGLDMSGDQIIENGDFIASVQQVFGAGAADITRSSGHKNTHGSASCFSVRSELTMYHGKWISANSCRLR